MIVICAASGRIGSRVIAQLQKTLAPSDFIAGSRDPNACLALKDKDIEVRRIDYDDPEGLREAFDGAERVLFIPSFADTERRKAQGFNVIDAAKACGVKQLVFIGIMDTRPDSPLPFAHAYGAIERALAESSLDWTVLRTSMYTGNLEEQYPLWLERRELVTCAGDGRISYVSRDDVAASAAGVLTSPIDRHAEKVYVLTGPQALSYDEVGALISELFDTPIEVKHVSVEEFTDALRQIWGLAYEGAAHVIKVTPLFQTVFKEGMMSEVTDHVERLSGRPPEDVRAWLQRHPRKAA